MKIAIISGANFACPPTGYGSEVLQWLLARELALLGHDIHLFGPGGSRAPRGVHLHYTRGGYGLVDYAAESDPWDWYRDVIQSCDIIHDATHTCLTYERAYLAGGPPAIAVRSGIDFRSPRLPAPARNVVVPSQAARDCALAGRSAWARTGHREWDTPPGMVRDARIVPLAIDTDWYTPGPTYPDGSAVPVERGDYLLYLGRPHPAKGVGRILDLARRMPDQRIVLAWRPASPDHVEWDQRYREVAGPLPNVEIVTLPEIGHHEAKRDLLRRAAGMITLPVYVEAFGLTTIEAMACGCPVIATRNGAAPEIIAPGVTGFLVDDVDDDGSLDIAVHALDILDRAACRKTAVDDYAARGMAQEYVSLYQDVIEGRGWG